MNTVAHVSKLNGKNCWRVTDEKHRPLRTRLGVPFDRGGYGSHALANDHVDAMNEAAMVNARAEKAASVTKRQRLAAKRDQRRRIAKASA